MSQVLEIALGDDLHKHKEAFLIQQQEKQAEQEGLDEIFKDSDSEEGEICGEDYGAGWDLSYYY